jgi:hypothetical protein
MSWYVTVGSWLDLTMPYLCYRSRRASKSSIFRKTFQHQVRFCIKIVLACPWFCVFVLRSASLSTFSTSARFCMIQGVNFFTVWDDRTSAFFISVPSVQPAWQSCWFLSLKCIYRFLIFWHGTEVVCGDSFREGWGPPAPTLKPFSCYNLKNYKKTEMQNLQYVNLSA